MFMRKLEFCKKAHFYSIPMGFTTVTDVYHVDKTQLRLNIDQYTWNLHDSSKRPYGYLNMICSTFSALNFQM